MTPSFVLDCSVTIPWFVADERNDYADEILRQLRKSGAIVPALWNLETANVLLIAEKKKRLTRADIVRIVAFLFELPISQDYESLSRGLTQVLDLAREQSLTAYDAANLELAIRMGLPLATLDRELIRAARALSVRIV